MTTDKISLFQQTRMLKTNESFTDDLFTRCSQCVDLLATCGSVCFQCQQKLFNLPLTKENDWFYEFWFTYENRIEGNQGLFELYKRGLSGKFCDNASGTCKYDGTHLQLRVSNKLYFQGLMEYFCFNAPCPFSFSPEKYLYNDLCDSALKLNSFVYQGLVYFPKFQPFGIIRRLVTEMLDNVEFDIKFNAFQPKNSQLGCLYGSSDNCLTFKVEKMTVIFDIPAVVGELYETPKAIKHHFGTCCHECTFITNGRTNKCEYTKTPERPTILKKPINILRSLEYDPERWGTFKVLDKDILFRIFFKSGWKLRSLNKSYFTAFDLYFSATRAHRLFRPSGSFAKLPLCVFPNCIAPLPNTKKNALRFISTSAAEIDIIIQTDRDTLVNRNSEGCSTWNSETFNLNLVQSDPITREFERYPTIGERQEVNDLNYCQNISDAHKYGGNSYNSNPIDGTVEGTYGLPFKASSILNDRCPTPANSDVKKALDFDPTLIHRYNEEVFDLRFTDRNRGARRNLFLNSPAGTITDHIIQQGAEEKKPGFQEFKMLEHTTEDTKKKLNSANTREKEIIIYNNAKIKVFDSFNHENLEMPRVPWADANDEDKFIFSWQGEENKIEATPDGSIVVSNSSPVQLATSPDDNSMYIEGKHSGIISRVMAVGKTVADNFAKVLKKSLFISGEYKNKPEIFTEKERELTLQEAKNLGSIFFEDGSKITSENKPKIEEVLRKRLLLKNEMNKLIEVEKSKMWYTTKNSSGMKEHSPLHSDDDLPRIDFDDPNLEYNRVEELMEDEDFNETMAKALQASLEEGHEVILDCDSDGTIHLDVSQANMGGVVNILNDEVKEIQAKALSPQMLNAIAQLESVPNTIDPLGLEVSNTFPEITHLSNGPLEDFSKHRAIKLDVKQTIKDLIEFAKRGGLDPWPEGYETKLGGLQALMSYCVDPRLKKTLKRKIKRLEAKERAALKLVKKKKLLDNEILDVEDDSD